MIDINFILLYIINNKGAGTRACKERKMMITEINGLFYVTGLVFSDGSSLFYGPFATKEEAESKIK